MCRSCQPWECAFNNRITDNKEHVRVNRRSIGARTEEIGPLQVRDFCTCS
ncbi:hypothetical protein LINPERHAP1_LOCUS13276 [Linum perenne]